MQAPNSEIPVKQFPGFEWLHIVNPTVEQMQRLATHYALDVHLVEDSLQTGHLPKWENVGNSHFMIVRAYTANPEKRGTSIAQLTHKIALFYQPNRLITICKSEVKILEKLTNDYGSVYELVLAILKEVIHTYDPPTKFMSQKVDQMEYNLFTKSDYSISLTSIYYLKTRTRLSRNLLSITQNVLNDMVVDDRHATTLQDIRDEVLNLLVSLEDTLDNANNLLNTYISVNNQKNNDVMKLLTVISVFFLPLTFISSIYGMNFGNMPELNWENGYYYVLGLMFVIALLIYWWFKRKKII